MSDPYEGHYEYGPWIGKTRGGSVTRQVWWVYDSAMNKGKRREEPTIWSTGPTEGEPVFYEDEAPVAVQQQPFIISGSVEPTVQTPTVAPVEVQGQPFVIGGNETAPAPVAPEPVQPQVSAQASGSKSAAARVPCFGNRALVQVYLRRLRDKVFSKEQHKRLHPLI